MTTWLSQPLEIRLYSVCENKINRIPSVEKMPSSILSQSNELLACFQKVIQSRFPILYESAVSLVIMLLNKLMSTAT